MLFVCVVLFVVRVNSGEMYDWVKNTNSFETSLEITRAMTARDKAVPGMRTARASNGQHDVGSVEFYGEIISFHLALSL